MVVKAALQVIGLNEPREVVRGRRRDFGLYPRAIRVAHSPDRGLIDVRFFLHGTVFFAHDKLGIRSLEAYHNGSCRMAHVVLLLPVNNSARREIGCRSRRASRHS